jgi:hypothetical protein
MLMFLIHAHTIAEYLGETVGLIANSLVFYYLLTEKQRELQQYRNILLLNCFVDYFCLGVQILNQPVGFFLFGIFACLRFSLKKLHVWNFYWKNLYVWEFYWKNLYVWDFHWNFVYCRFYISKILRNWTFCMFEISYIENFA